MTDRDRGERAAGHLQARAMLGWTPPALIRVIGMGGSGESSAVLCKTGFDHRKAGGKTGGPPELERHGLLFLGVSNHDAVASQRPVKNL